MDGTTFLAIIGGGPAALMAAITAANVVHGISITICERNDRLGKKLLVTGNGQCNLTHAIDVASLFGHFGNNGKFLRQAFNALSPEKTMEMFETWNLPLAIREDGKVFPASFHSGDVLQTLLEQIRKHDIHVLYNWHVNEVIRTTSGFTLINSHKESLTAKTLILATGGITYPATGSTGDGYAIASSLGHTIITPHPALTPVKTVDTSITQLSGVSFEDVIISKVNHTGTSILSKGSLLVTHEGLSGPAILHVSRYVSTNDTISVCFIPGENKEVPDKQTFAKYLLALAATAGAKQLKTLLASLPISHSFIEWMLAKLHIDQNRKAAEISKIQYMSIAEVLVDSHFVVSLDSCLSKAMVTAGGVALTEIKTSSMESKICPHLFIVGELLDLDGDTGGFNLQVAWSTGYLAGLHAVKSIDR